MAEWSIAAVLKTVEGNTSGGSNPSLSAQELQVFDLWLFCVRYSIFYAFSSLFQKKNYYLRGNDFGSSSVFYIKRLPNEIFRNRV